MPTKELIAHWDSQRRTCLLVRRTLGQALYIPLVTGSHLKLLKMKENGFDAAFKPIVNEDSGRVVALFLRYTQDLGAEKDVMEALATMVKVSPAQREHAQALITKNKPPAKVKGPY